MANALLALVALVPPRWWRRRPYLPIPDRNWLAFRLETAYGSDRRAPTGGELGEVLAWMAAFRALQRRARVRGRRG